MKTIILTTIITAATAAGCLWADDKAEGSKKSKQDGPAKKKSDLVELHVTGMSCHNCADAVEDALAAIKGVEVESVDAKGNFALVKYDPKKVKRETLVAAIKATDEYVLEQTVEYAKLEYESDGSFSFDGKPFTGTATDQHKKTGTRSKAYQFKEGKLHGLVREWYADGTPAAKKFYKEGKRHGKTEYWDEKGKLTATKIYKDDVHVDKDGKPVEE